MCRTWLQAQSCGAYGEALLLSEQGVQADAFARAEVTGQGAQVAAPTDRDTSGNEHSEQDWLVAFRKVPSAGTDDSARQPPAASQTAPNEI